MECVVSERCVGGPVAHRIMFDRLTQSSYYSQEFVVNLS
jgi:hypothetical protein